MQNLNKRKPYPTFEQCVKMGGKPQKAEPSSHIKKRYDEIPQCPYGGISIEHLLLSNLSESLSRFDFKDFK